MQESVLPALDRLESVFQELADQLRNIITIFREAERRAARLFEELGSPITRKQAIGMLASLNGGFLDPQWDQMSLNDLDQLLLEILRGRSAFGAVGGEGKQAADLYKRLLAERSLPTPSEEELRELLSLLADNAIPTDDQGNPCHRTGLPYPQMIELWRSVSLEARIAAREALRQKQDQAQLGALADVGKLGVLGVAGAAVGAVLGIGAAAAGTGAGAAAAARIGAAATLGVGAALIEEPQATDACPTGDDQNEKRGWKPGDAVDAADESGNYPAWETVRSRYWKTRAFKAGENEFSPQNMGRMKNGFSPRVRIVVKDRQTGQIMELLVEKEIHHIGGRAIKNPHSASNLTEVWPWEHASMDSNRRLSYIFVRFK